MTVTVVLAVGLVVGAWFGWKGGQAWARALRAWRDFKTTKDAIRGLFTNSMSQAAKAARYVLVGVLAGAVLVLVVVVQLHHT